MKSLKNFLIMFSILASACSTGCAEIGEELDETIGVEDEVSIEEKISIQFESFPETAQFGDSLFVAVALQNRTEERVPLGEPDQKACILMRYTCSCCDVPDLNFEWECPPRPKPIPMIDEDVETVPFTPMVDILPRPYVDPYECVRRGIQTVELPSLEDWKTPFWKAVRTFLNSSEAGAKTILEFEFEYLFWTGKTETFSVSLPLELRSAQEMKWLQSWQETKYDRLEMKKVPTWVQIGPCRLSSELLCPDISKPAGAGMPRTVQEWRDLEAALTPGTLRDEVTFTRHILEIMENSDFRASFHISREENYERWRSVTLPLRSWLEILPPCERAGLAQQMSRSQSLSMFTSARNSDTFSYLSETFEAENQTVEIILKIRNLIGGYLKYVNR